MKFKFLGFVLAASLSVLGTANADTFINGGFETGTLTGWTGGGGSWSGFPAFPVAPSYYAGGPANNTIVGAGVDPISGLNRVYTGSNAVRVNDSINNYSVSTLTQSVANYSDNNIYFAWQANLQASHDLTDSDYFSLTLTDTTLNSTLVARQYSSASAPGIFTNLGNGWYTSGWRVEQIDLAALGAVGHNFTLSLLASDCPYGGHAGYVYLDGFAPVIPDGDNVPDATNTMLLLGSALTGLAVWRRKGHRTTAA